MSRTAANPKRTISGVAERRAEILGMIGRLEENRRKLSSRPPVETAPSVSPAARASSRAPASRRPPISGRISMPSISRSDETAVALMTAVQSLEARLGRIEDRLATLGARRSSRAPAPAGAPNDAIFAGLIKGQILSDMLQLVTSNTMSGVFVIESEISQCRLYFDDGRIVHAENGEMTGEDAFFAAFGAQSGRYHFTETNELPVERTVSVGTQYLVLEALRRMDEVHGDAT